MTLRAGKYGPYVSHGKINATIPRSRDADTITLEEAVSLIAAKAATNGGGKPKRTAPKKAAAKTAASTTARKPAAKKPAAKKAPAKAPAAKARRAAT